MLDNKKGWVLKNWCLWTVMLGKTLESPLDSKEIKPVNPKWNQHWIFIGRTDAEAEAPILWPSDSESQLTGKKTLMLGKIEGRWEGPTEDKTVVWHHQVNGHKFEKTLGVGDGQGSLVYCSPRGHKELNTTEQLNSSNNSKNSSLQVYL